MAFFIDFFVKLCYLNILLFDNKNKIYIRETDMGKKVWDGWSGGVRTFPSCDDFTAGFSTAHYFNGHPAQIELADSLNKLLKGASVALTTRGMTAIEAVLFAFAQNGQQIACSQDIYPGTRNLLLELEEGELIKVVWFDPSDLNQVALAAASSAIVFTETIGNARMMRVADIPAMAKICWNEMALLVVDTTFTPLYPVPDNSNVVVVSSLTKYHQIGEDLMGGIISSVDQGVIDKIRATQFFKNHQMLPSIAVRFLRPILHLFKMRHTHICANALKLAEVCEGHSSVNQVWYPGLKSHQQHSLVDEIYGGYAGGVLYCQLKGGEEAVIKLADTLAAANNWKIAVSYGGEFWRILPFIGLLARNDGQGLVRLASDWKDPLLALAAFTEALNSL